MTAPLSSASKAAWREWAERRRSEVDFATVSRLVTTWLLRWRTVTDANAVLVYLPMGTEIDLALVCERVRCVATRTPERRGKLTIHELGSELERHRYGFMQPTAESPLVEESEIDVVLTPGLVFAQSGERLGRGAGYYDELFTRLPNATRIGVVPSQLVVPQIPTEAHDVPMHALVTEIGITDFRSRSSS